MSGGGQRERPARFGYGQRGKKAAGLGIPAPGEV